MAKVELAPPFQRLQGKIENLSCRWMHGQQIVMKTPDMPKVAWSKAQKAMADPQASAQYEKPGMEASRQPLAA